MTLPIFNCFDIRFIGAKLVLEKLNRKNTYIPIQNAIYTKLMSGAGNGNKISKHVIHI